MMDASCPVLAPLLADGLLQQSGKLRIANAMSSERGVLDGQRPQLILSSVSGATVDELSLPRVGSPKESLQSPLCMGLYAVRVLALLVGLGADVSVLPSWSRWCLSRLEQVALSTRRELCPCAVRVSILEV